MMHETFFRGHHGPNYNPSAKPRPLSEEHPVSGVVIERSFAKDCADPGWHILLGVMFFDHVVSSMGLVLISHGWKVRACCICSSE